MAARWLLLCSLAACGRVGFAEIDDGNADAGIDDALVDGATVGTFDAMVCNGTSHDEDADGLADPCDVCPHVADPGQVDGDDDGVGDACDPRPDDAGETLVLFDAFENDQTASYSLFGAIAGVSGDQLRVDAGFHQVSIPTGPGNLLIEAAGTIDSVDPARSQLSAGVQAMRSADEVAWFGELFEIPAERRITMQRVLNGFAYTQVANELIPDGPLMAPGRFEEAFVASDDGALRYHAIVQAAGTDLELSGTSDSTDFTQADLKGDFVGGYDYVVVIRSTFGD